MTPEKAELLYLAGLGAFVAFSIGVMLGEWYERRRSRRRYKDLFQ
jgi:hypothetical protein